MCGIIGGNWFTSKEQTFTQLNKIIHRGRDASQVDVVDDFYIGHNRLSIQDLSSSANQPMWNDDKSVCIVYNGELWDSFETKELKSLPFARHLFCTKQKNKKHCLFLGIFFVQHKRIKSIAFCAASSLHNTKE